MTAREGSSKWRRQPHQVAQGRQQRAARRAVGSRRPRLDRDGAVGGELVTHGARFGDRAVGEGRLVHRQRREQLCPHRLLPGAPGQRLDRAPQQAPAGVAVGPEARCRRSRGDRCRKAGQHVVGVGLEGLEFDLRAEGEPRAVGEQVAHRGPCCPAHAAQLWDVPGDRIVHDHRPASASRAITVATIDLANDPAAKRVAAVTGSPVVASATPLEATVTAVSRSTRSRPPAPSGWTCARRAGLPGQGRSRLTPR